MNDPGWHSTPKTLIFSFLFAIGLHAALFAFVKHLPTFRKVSPAIPPKLTVHLRPISRPTPSIDVHTVRPFCFSPEPPPKRVPRKKTPPLSRPKAIKKTPKKTLPIKKKPLLSLPSPKPSPSLRKAHPPQAEKTILSSVSPSKSALPAAPTSPSTSQASLPTSPSSPPQRKMAYPDYERSPRLTYPPLARRRGIEGSVILKVLVSREGHPLQVVLEKSSGSALLDKAAIKAVKSWIFKPGTLNDSPIQMWVRVPVTYKLK